MQASITEAVGNILGDPISIVLVAMGALLVGFAMTVFGYLSLGAVVSLVTPN